MTQTIVLPDLWLLVAPCGCFDGWMRASHEGVATRASADIAWLDFEPKKRVRERMQAEGWVVRGGEFADWNSSDKGPCLHTPKWAPSTTGKES